MCSLYFFLNLHTCSITVLLQSASPNLPAQEGLTCVTYSYVHVYVFALQGPLLPARYSFQTTEAEIPCILCVCPFLSHPGTKTPNPQDHEIYRISKVLTAPSKYSFRVNLVTMTLRKMLFRCFTPKQVWRQESEHPPRGS